MPTQIYQQLFETSAKKCLMQRTVLIRSDERRCIGMNMRLWSRVLFILEIIVTGPGLHFDFLIVH